MKSRVLALAVLGVAASAASAAFPSSPLDFKTAPRPVLANGPFNFSSALGSGMVLRMAPAQALVWGSDTPGNTVNVTLDGAGAMSGVVDAMGIWRVQLPATGPGGPHVVSATSTGGGATLTLNDVYFGSVYVCGGQSNMRACRCSRELPFKHSFTPFRAHRTSRFQSFRFPARSTRLLKSQTPRPTR
jgi:hypothetical protein